MGNSYDPIVAERNALRKALADSIEAWKIEERDWAMVRDWFTAQPDEHRHDAKELIAAIEGRVVACRSRRRSLEALAAGEDAR